MGRRDAHQTHGRARRDRRRQRGASKADVERARTESVPLLYKLVRLIELEAALRSAVDV